MTVHTSRTLTLLIHRTSFATGREDSDISMNEQMSECMS